MCRVGSVRLQWRRYNSVRCCKSTFSATLQSCGVFLHLFWNWLWIYNMTLSPLAQVWLWDHVWMRVFSCSAGTCSLRPRGFSVLWSPGSFWLCAWRNWRPPWRRLVTYAVVRSGTTAGGAEFTLFGLFPCRWGSSTLASCGQNPTLKESRWSWPSRKRYCRRRVSPGLRSELSFTETRVPAGPERSHPAAGVRGGVRHSGSDVRGLPSGGSQGLLERSGASQAEGAWSSHTDVWTWKTHQHVLFDETLHHLKQMLLGCAGFNLFYSV